MREAVGPDFDLMVDAHTWWRMGDRSYSPEGIENVARGIAMLVPAIAGLPVAEYAPNLVKKTIVGAGHGEKAQVRMMIGVLLPKADPRSDDAADALAIAVCHAHHRQSAILRSAAR